MEDVSKEFPIDKTKGNLFFYEQTGLDETTFLSTSVSMQQKVELDSAEQTMLTQKIANILSSGEDNTSYKTIINSLNKKQLEEIGTERSTGRPINIVENEIKNLEYEKDKIDEFISNSQNYKEEVDNLKKEIDNNKNKINNLEKVKKAKEQINIEREKIKVKNNIIAEYKEKIENLKPEEKEVKKESKLSLIILIALIILNIVFIFVKISKIINISLLTSTLIYIAIIAVNNAKKVKEKRKINLEKIANEKEKEIIENNISKMENEIQETNKEILKIQEHFESETNDLEKEEALEKLQLNIEEIENEITKIKNANYSNGLKLNTIEYEQKSYDEKLENKVSIKEKLMALYEQKDNLKQKENILNIVKENLEEAYKELKETITPKFTKELSNNILNITNGKYLKANFDADTGLTVEKENGEYVNCNKLSTGTIDQLYLSLRLSAVNEITKEKVPIILDESFAYFDDERLENILKFINENFENQIIILTCSNREKEIMNKLNIEYNLVEI